MIIIVVMIIKMNLLLVWQPVMKHVSSDYGSDGARRVIILEFGWAKRGQLGPGEQQICPRPCDDFFN